MSGSWLGLWVCGLWLLSVCLSVCLSPSVYLTTRLSVVLSICLSVCLSACLPVCLSVHMSVCLSVYPSVRLSICLPACLSVYTSVYPSVRLSVCLSLPLSLTLSVCLSVCLSVSLSVRLSVCLSVCGFCLSVAWSVSLNLNGAADEGGRAAAGSASHEGDGSAALGVCQAGEQGCPLDCQRGGQLAGGHHTSSEVLMGALRLSIPVPDAVAPLKHSLERDGRLSPDGGLSPPIYFSVMLLRPIRYLPAALLEAPMREAESLGSHDLALLMWACGAMRQPLAEPEPALLAARTGQLMGNLSMRELSMCVWGLAKMEYLDEDLMDLLAALIENKLQGPCCPQVTLP